MNEMREELTEKNREVLINIAEELNLTKEWEEKAIEKVMGKIVLNMLKKGKSIEDIIDATENVI